MLLAIIIILLLKVSIWTLPFVRDAFGYAYVGSEIAKGAVLYKDIWDHKPPGVYWLDASIFTLFPSYLIGIRLVSTVFSILAALVFYKLLRQFFSHQVSVATTILFALFSNIYMLTQGDNMVETYMLAPLIALYYFFVKAVKENCL